MGHSKSSEVPPFGFHCQRSGRCCSVGDGYVWLEPGEVTALAAALEMQTESFSANYVREVPDPVDGSLRLSLRDDRGRCVLLEGSNECRVYAARPVHCQTFPYWERILTDPHALERARSVCPGIAVSPPEGLRERAFAALAELYVELDSELEQLSPRCELSGLCCRFDEAGHDLYATGLEADYAVYCQPVAPEPEAPGRCAYHVQGRCTARAGRALGCRSYYCDADKTEALLDLHERYLRRVRDIEAEVGYPSSYGRFPEQLLARGVGGAQRGETSSSVRNSAQERS